MAKRPIFIAEPHGSNLVRVQTIEFTWFAGMAMSQRQKSMRSLHQTAQTLHPDSRILEVSRMSDNPLGERLSAFNLTFSHPGTCREVPIECIFQSSKVFERGGPFHDLIDAKPADAKRDARLQNSGALSAFQYNGVYWPKEPFTAFYDWIYIHALCNKPELAKAVLSFDIFTDIAFNPSKSINCQAGSVALFVALVRADKLDVALSSRDAFLSYEQSATIYDDAVDGQKNLF